MDFSTNLWSNLYLLLSESMDKEAELKSTPQPHQLEAKKLFETNPKGLVAAHGVGSGKTFTSIISTYNAQGPVEVIVPAPLIANYQKELIKHLGRIPENVRIRSYEKFVRDKDIRPGSMVIIDEAHRLRNPKSARYMAFKANRQNISKALLLTGSLIYNEPSDIAPAVNIASGKEILPEGKKEFEKKFVKEVPVYPGLLDRLRGVTPGIRRELKKPGRLQWLLSDLVHFHTNPTESADYPKKEEVVYKVPMSDEQHKYYRYAIAKLPWLLRRKIERNLPPDKKESANLNAFLTATRQIANTPVAYVKGMSPTEGAEMSPKIKMMASHLLEGIKNNPRHKALVYSHYLRSGLIPYSSVLNKMGIPHNFFTGKETPAEKKRIMEEYNTGKTPVMLISSAGAEGLDTKGTREIQIAEPHWNEEKIKQIIGRGVRYQSHADLPEEERKVLVRRYQSTIPQDTGLLARLSSFLFGKSKITSVDEYLHGLSQEKEKLNQKFWNVIRSAQKKKAPEVTNAVRGLN